MGKGSRSPLLGYNHNVRYRGRIYHVQTEDSGPGNPHIFTHLFFQGTILATKRLDYDGASADEAVRVLMQAQHKAILKELKAARYDDKIQGFFAHRNEDPFLDVVGEPGAGESATAPTAAPAPIPDERTLDLDALPDVEPAPVAPMEPLPPAFPAPRPTPGSTGVPGPGVYSMRGGQQDRPFAPGSTRTPPPDDPVKPPVVVIRPPSARPARVVPQQPPPGGVVVQRTVVVGVGGPGANQQRPRRPRPPIPYVVKEGSHPIAPNTARVAPPVPTPRPQTTAPGAKTPPVQATTISDKSLDEVILAYLSQDDER